METQATLDKFVVTKENLAWLTPQVMEALEDSYRRGYFHGSSQCFDYFQRKKSISKIADWIDNKIEYWLYRESSSKKILPPTI